jgi:hypothetical protein
MLFTALCAAYPLGLPRRIASFAAACRRALDDRGNGALRCALAGLYRQPGADPGLACGLAAP